MTAPEQFNDDIQGILYDEVLEIFSGRLDKKITDDHIKAAEEGHRQFIESLKEFQ